MVESVVGKLLVIEKLVDLVDVLPNLGEVEGTEVLEETFVL